MKDTYPSASILITGHSAGGAIATLAALEIIELYSDTKVITFGSPRVGDAAFANYFKVHFDNNNSYRIVSRNDIVPSNPAYSFDYHHVPREVWYYSYTNE